jgi:hypothetical protein
VPKDEVRIERVRPDVDRVCELVAGHVAALHREVGLGGRPAPSRPWPKVWLTHARLLIDSDGVAPEHVEAAVAWMAGPSTRAEFWRGNVRTPRKLREYWPRMVLDARAERAGRRRGRPPTSPETSAGLDKVMADRARWDAERRASPPDRHDDDGGTT